MALLLKVSILDQRQQPMERAATLVQISDVEVAYNGGDLLGMFGEKLADALEQLSKIQGNTSGPIDYPVGTKAWFRALFPDT